METKAIVLNPKDSVATALSDLEAGSVIEIKVDGQALITLRDNIPFAHKFSLKAIAVGEPVVKYGEVIGEASKPIKQGEHVHVHNVVSRRFRSGVAKVESKGGN